MLYFAPTSPSYQFSSLTFHKPEDIQQDGTPLNKKEEINKNHKRISSLLVDSLVKQVPTLSFLSWFERRYPKFKLIHTRYFQFAKVINLFLLISVREGTKFVCFWWERVLSFVLGYKLPDLNSNQEGNISHYDFTEGGHRYTSKTADSTAWIQNVNSSH